LHNNREYEEVKESDLDELKQNVQSARNELISDIKATKDNLKRYANIIHKGFVMLGEKHIRSNEGNQINEEKLKKFHSFVMLDSKLETYGENVEKNKDRKQNKFQLTISSEDTNRNEREE
jgi:hypothetical protein